MNQWKQHAHALSNGLESTLNIVVVSELLHTNWTDYITLLEQNFPSLAINIVSAPQEDALQMLLDQTAQLALMFEREHLDSREQFVELKERLWFLLLQNIILLLNSNKCHLSKWCKPVRLWWRVETIPSSLNCYFPKITGAPITIIPPA